MYAFIQGQLVSLDDGEAVLLVGGIGYRLSVPGNVGQEHLEQTTLFYTSFVVRELSQTLYGFLRKEERDLFEELIALSGIGPRTALAMITYLGVEGLKRAAEEQGEKQLASVPGIGKKTAARLALELRGVMKKFSFVPSALAPNSPSQDAFAALVHLGVSHLKAEEAVKKAVQELSDRESSSALISCALKYTHS